MKKEDILRRSRAENQAAFMDERERDLRLREDSFSFGFGLLLALVLFCIKLWRGQPRADVLTLITGMSAAGFAFRAVKNRKRSDAVFAVICALLALLNFCRFLMEAA